MATIHNLKWLLVLTLYCLNNLISHCQTNENSPYMGLNNQGYPAVFGNIKQELIEKKLKYEASIAFQLHQLPHTKQSWEAYRLKLKKKIVKSANVFINHLLPLNYQEASNIEFKEFSVKNIIFQSRPKIYVTANLYVPHGNGKFPAVVVMHGHWPNGKQHEITQALGQTLAINGYVCLVVDAWGSGERTTIHGENEYHGANLGASLLNIGETLLGSQLSDNIRAVDLLCSLPYVDTTNIGATGASGGGNQTMWLSALDERIKAAVPVVSVGTFEFYIMQSNCVCELLLSGLTFTEEAGILGLIAPRALQLFSASQDSNPTFLPSEMLRSYHNATPIFEMLNAKEKFSYQLFNTTHGYWPEMRVAMIAWFNKYLKEKNGNQVAKPLTFQPIDEKLLMVYEKKKREDKVESIADYCKRRGAEVRKRMLGVQQFDILQKRKELSMLLGTVQQAVFRKAYEYDSVEKWRRIILETSERRLIPVLIRLPVNSVKTCTILCNPKGKAAISDSTLAPLIRQGHAILIVDLWGTGETTSVTADLLDRGLSPFHTLSRSSLWLGKNIMGNWVADLTLILNYAQTQFPHSQLRIEAEKETGIAALFGTALGWNVKEIVLKNCPISYQFDERQTIDFFSMAIHVPDFLNWGDISLASALTGKKVIFQNPVSMSGTLLNQYQLKKYQLEFKKMRESCKQNGITIFK